MVLDATLHVLMANRYFYECFQVTPQETEAHRLYDLGNGQWNIPALRHLLEEILPHHTAFDDFEVMHTFPHLGPKRMLLNARQIVRTHGTPPLILLAIEDITTRWQAQALLRQQRDLLAVTLDSIGDAVLTTDTAGRITFLNPVAEALTGWPLQDALGQPCEVVFRLVHERTRQPLESPVARVLRDGLVVDLAPQTVLLTRDWPRCPDCRPECADPARGRADCRASWWSFATCRRPAAWKRSCGRRRRWRRSGPSPGGLPTTSTIFSQRSLAIPNWCRARCGGTVPHWLSLQQVHHSGPPRQSLSAADSHL